MWASLTLLAVSIAFQLAHAVNTTSGSLGWQFVQSGTTGVVALQSIVVSPSLILLIDQPTGNPLQINGHQAWAALWNTETNNVTAVDLSTITFCGSGSFLSNGTMISTGGTPATIFDGTFTYPVGGDGQAAIRVFEPCHDPAGVSCTLFDDPSKLHLAEARWYSSTLRIFDGSLMVVGGMHTATLFFNTPDQAANTFEFFPPKDGGAPRSSAFLNRSMPANLFPRAFALPDGKVFIVANNQSIIYDIEANTETILPDIPNGVRVTNPYDGTATLLPLSPPDYIPEVLVCGGTNTTDQLTNDDIGTQLSSQDPASDQCSRITLTPEGIEKGWQVERMPEGRTMPETILMPNGQVLIINGAGTGYAAIGGVRDPVGDSNADNAVTTPVLYNPSAHFGRRFNRDGLPTTDIARVYHSSISLTPNGNIFIAGSNPNPNVTTGVKFSSEYRVEYLNPPYMTIARPVLEHVPKQVDFNKKFTVDVQVPNHLGTSSIQVALMDLGFSSHAFHSSSRLVFLNANLSKDEKKLEITSPPDNRIYPPGPAYLFLTVDDVTSKGIKIMVGSGATPPVSDQGVHL
ncbi:hypothetical protein D9758_009316 [Tetrapyrgos nigripes]|uniref:Glyoxal oxidase n=1 Tax=Tetrapyrgos nigripes TaxID=182062 RepID=A0A8H5LPL9_9AGAR|nr:hypothetical protein D9758_009316 [Tetrapyrgos nigripes]